MYLLPTCRITPRRSRLECAREVLESAALHTNDQLAIEVLDEKARRAAARSGSLASRSAGNHLALRKRDKGFEPSTSTLARSHSTTELFPLAANNLLYQMGYRLSKTRKADRKSVV